MSDDTVKVTLNVSDWQHVPVRTYTRTLEFDREEWDEMSREAREQGIEEALTEFCLNTFSRDYDIDGGNLDDPTV